MYEGNRDLEKLDASTEENKREKVVAPGRF
jgi:hypothetical protein